MGEVRGKTQRSATIDVAKGFLILCLLYGHTPIFSFDQGLDDDVIRFMENSKIIYSLFFMQSFFLITGYCTSFTRDFKTFCWRNIKTLLLPAITLSIMGAYLTCLYSGDRFSLGPIIGISQWIYQEGPWFIIALFFCKILYWPISKCNYRIQLLNTLALLAIGIYCNIKLWEFPEYLWYQHGLLMLPFLAMGNMVKQYHQQVEKNLLLLSVSGAVCIIFEILISFICGFSIPVIDANILMPFYLVPLHFINVIGGTSLILLVAKKLKSNRWLAQIGTYTLVFYLWNGIIHYKIIHIMLPIYNDSSICYMLVFHAISLLLCIITLYYFSRLIYETKCLKWIVGKW